MPRGGRASVTREAYCAWVVFVFGRALVHAQRMHSANTVQPQPSALSPQSCTLTLVQSCTLPQPPMEVCGRCEGGVREVMREV